MDEVEQETTISEVTRRVILDMIASNWSGRLDEVEFLGRIYDLDNMPSHDGRFKSASSDIRQHRIRNSDWPEDWVFTDPRFKILRGPDGVFLRFIAETVHPAVRDPEVAKELVEEFNGEMSKDGWHLVEVRRMSGRAVYGAEKIDARSAAFEEPTGWSKVDRQVEEARQMLRNARFEEQYQSVGHMCREIIISVARAHYDPQRHAPADGIVPSETDAARMIENFFAVDLAGSANEEARAHAKASLKLAVALQHRRTADFRAAALCLEGTLSVVNIVAIIAGRRDRLSSPSPL